MARQSVIGGIKDLVAQLRAVPAPKGSQAQVREGASRDRRLKVLLRFLDH